MEVFIDKEFEKFMQSQGLKSFDDLWKQPMEVVEEGNFRGAGSQSEVSRWHHVYVKKQENYTTNFSWFNPQAKCAREFKSIIAWQKLDIPTLEPLYFYQEPRARRAILVTKALDGYQPLDVWLSENSDPALRAKVFARVASLIADIHSKGWYHHCFFPKHVFVLKSNPEVLRMIDLEKARKQFRTNHRDMADIASFFRRCVWNNPKEGLQFMKAYWGVNKFENKHRLMLKRLQDRVAAKS